jgi:PAS domain S-box-containing protein
MFPAHHLQSLEGLFDRLAQVQTQLQDYFELASDLLCVLQPDGRFQVLSPAWQQVMGWDIARCKFQSWLQWVHPEDVDKSRAYLQSIVAGTATGEQGASSRSPVWFENRMRHADGSDRLIAWHITVGTGGFLYASAKELKVIQDRETRLQRLMDALPVCLAYVDAQQRYQFVNHTYEIWLKQQRNSICGRFVWEVIGEATYQKTRHCIERALAGELVNCEFSVPTPTGTLRHVAATLVPDVDAIDNHVKGYHVLLMDITERRQAEAVLRQQATWNHLLGSITQRIRQSLDLSTILNTTVAEVRQFLDTDRVVIYQFHSDWSGSIVVESVSSEQLSILGQTIHDPCFHQWVEHYRQGRIRAIADIHVSSIQPCYLELLSRFQVRANLVLPILQGDVLWGLLIAHHCSAPRSWQRQEIHLLEQLAAQVAIAIQQSELYQRVQQLNVNLETQVQKRTAQLQQLFDFEALLKRITDKVRDSLDEAQILQTAVRELAIGLNVNCCDTALYDMAQQTATICCEYIRSEPMPSEHQVVPLDNLPEVYNQLFQGCCVQFCLIAQPAIAVRDIEHKFSILSCPLSDERGVFGDMWLFKPTEDSFNSMEVRLVQQVANQCAIAIRQARLYQAAQLQVVELERLNHLKDDFLSSVSHELRTPISNVKMATQMLELNLDQLGWLDDEAYQVSRYLQILKDESQREINLINDLLDLSRLEADTEPLLLSTIDPHLWITHVAEPFIERARSQQQQLKLDIPTQLPMLTTDLSNLERILTELLNNACKYTPIGETITLSVQMVERRRSPAQAHNSLSNAIVFNQLPTESLALMNVDLAQSAIEQLPAFLIRVSNSGVELPAEECDRIFDKFYRIPNHDPWKHGGTGLGLALVKRLAERLGATIHAESAANQVVFSLLLPVALESVT